jgi:hypothetical protein
MSSMHPHAADGLTAVVRLNGSRLQLVRHPVDLTMPMEVAA